MYRLELSFDANGITDWFTEFLPDCKNFCPPINNYVLEIHNTNGFLIDIRYLNSSKK